MMKLYAIVDRKAENVVNVFASANDVAAMRSFQMLCARDLGESTNIFHTYREDFVLYPVAEISMDGVALRVSAHGSQNLIDKGFKFETFLVNKPLQYGADFTLSDLLLIDKRMRPMQGECHDEEGDTNDEN